MTHRDEHQSQLVERWAAAEETEMPDPWRRVKLPRVGGLFAAGLDTEGNYLLLVSSSGRGVVDCRSGEKVARDPDTRQEEWLDGSRLMAKGLGPLEGEEIHVAGSFIGGGLSTRTTDGWTLQRAAPDWPKEIIWCESPHESGFYKGGTFYKLWEWDPPFAWGFSELGRTAVIACSNDVRVWTRS